MHEIALNIKSILSLKKECMHLTIISVKAWAMSENFTETHEYHEYVSLRSMLSGNTINEPRHEISNNSTFWQV